MAGTIVYSREDIIARGNGLVYGYNIPLHYVVAELCATVIKILDRDAIRLMRSEVIDALGVLADRKNPGGLIRLFNSGIEVRPSVNSPGVTKVTVNEFNGIALGVSFIGNLADDDFKNRLTGYSPINPNGFEALPGREKGSVQAAVDQIRGRGGILTDDLALIKY
jgi:hypothetical protein